VPLLDSARLILSMILPATPEVKAETFVYSSSDGQALSLDFYPAQLEGLAPLVVVVYGGSWQGGDKRVPPPPTLPHLDIELTSNPAS